MDQLSLFADTRSTAQQLCEAVHIGRRMATAKKASTTTFWPDSGGCGFVFADGSSIVLYSWGFCVSWSDGKGTRKWACERDGYGLGDLADRKARGGRMPDDAAEEP